MGFLAQLASSLITKLVSFLAALVAKWYAMKKARDEAHEINRLLKENHLKAQTKEERDQAARDILDRFSK